MTQAAEARPAAPRTVEVAVPTGLRRTFHYQWPESLGPAVPGLRVQVPFGRQQVVGYVVDVDSPPPPGVALLPVIERLDPVDRPTFTAHLLGIVRFMAD